MIVHENRRTRHLIGCLDRGAELLTALADLCREHGVHAGEIRARGVLSSLELRTYDMRGRVWEQERRFAKPCTLIELTATVGECDGHPTIDAGCLVARAGDNGIELLGGSLARAEVFAVDFVVEVFEDAVSARLLDPATGLRSWSAADGESHPADRAEQPAPPVSGKAPTSLQTTWSDAIALAAIVEEEAKTEPPPEPPLRAGDVLEHPRFARCLVERIEGDQEFVQVRLRNGRLVRLALDVLRLERDGSDGEQRRFRIHLAR